MSEAENQARNGKNAETASSDQVEYEVDILPSNAAGTPPSGVLPSIQEPPSDTAGILRMLVNQITVLSNTTDARFSEIATTQNIYSARLGELQQSRRSPPAPQETPIPVSFTDLRRDLFGDAPTPGTRPNDQTNTNLQIIQGSPTTEHQRDPRIEQQEQRITEMQRVISALTARVHQATSSSPEIDQVLKRAQNSPFTRRLLSTPLRPQEKLKITAYDGRTDPSQFLTAFSIAMGRTRFTPEEHDLGFCQMFVENLTGLALGWFSRLKADSIDSYNQLTTTFLKHHSMHIRQRVSDADLYTLTQAPKETLRSFITRFKAVASEVTIRDSAAIPALRNALWHESEFKRDLAINRPLTLEDALHRAAVFIQIDEEKVAMSKKYGQPKIQAARELRREIRPEPR